VINVTKGSTSDRLKKCIENATTDEKVDCMATVIAEHAGKVEKFIEKDFPGSMRKMRQDLVGAINQLDAETRKGIGSLDDHVKDKLNHVYDGLVAIDEELKPIALTHASMSNSLNRFIINTGQSFTKVEESVRSVETKMATKEDLKAFATKEDIDTMFDEIKAMLDKKQ